MCRASGSVQRSSKACPPRTEARAVSRCSSTLSGGVTAANRRMPPACQPPAGAPLRHTRDGGPTPRVSGSGSGPARVEVRGGSGGSPIPHGPSGADAGDTKPHEMRKNDVAPRRHDPQRAGPSDRRPGARRCVRRTRAQVRTGALAGTVAVRAGPDAPAGQPAPGLPDPVDPDAVRGPLRPAAAVPVPAAGLRTARAGVPDPGPVSYTHLRAHETRHDLV